MEFRITNTDDADKLKETLQSLLDRGSINYSVDEVKFISEEKGQFVGAWQYFCIHGDFDKMGYANAINTIHTEINIKPVVPVEKIKVEFTIEEPKHS